MQEDETEVLVVGAGPVGMMTALLLAEEGIHVRIIDREWRTAAHSYACVLHSGTLRLLDRLGLSQAVIAQGQRIESAAFYEGEFRRAEIKLSQLSGGFPFAVVLPQSSFESLLAGRLSEKYHVKVHWNHRLSDLEIEPHSITASIDKLVQTAKGYIVAEWDWTVKKKLEAKAAFVVGADGYGSMVRSRLGIEYERLAGPESFAVFEFETDQDTGSEVRIVLDEATTNVLWPLPGNRARWTFQLVKMKNPGEFPDKEREAVRIAEERVDLKTRNYVEKLIQMRAPWFKDNLKDIYWWARIRFEHRLAKQFGKGRGWLVGDSAHQTGPVGVQSMNQGLREAEDLAGKLKQVLRQGAPLGILDEYDSAHRNQWAQLLGGKDGAGTSPPVKPWIREHWARMLPCIPASGANLDEAVKQLGF